MKLDCAPARGSCLSHGRLYLRRSVDRKGVGAAGDRKGNAVFQVTVLSRLMSMRHCTCELYCGNEWVDLLI